MNLELPDDTVAFAAVLARAVADEHADLFTTLDSLGVLDLAGADSADPANANLNVAVALEEIARAGRRAPVAETIWARGHGLDTGPGFVAAVSDERSGEDRLVLCGSVAASLLAGSVDAPTVVPMPESARPARIEIDPGHLWLPVAADAPSSSRGTPTSCTVRSASRESSASPPSRARRRPCVRPIRQGRRSRW